MILGNASCMKCSQPIIELAGDVGLSRCRMPRKYFALVCSACGGQAEAEWLVAWHRMQPRRRRALPSLPR
jgi:hypothetical protein